MATLTKSSSLKENVASAFPPSYAPEFTKPNSHPIKLNRYKFSFLNLNYDQETWTKFVGKKGTTLHNIDLALARSLTLKVSSKGKTTWKNKPFFNVIVLILQGNILLLQERD